MARSQARIHTSVWRNPDFIKLTASAQATYWMVLSQPDVTMAGVVAYMPERWSQFRADGDIHADLAELEDGGFLVVDADTREVWVRSFIKHDGVIAGSKTRAAMWSAWSGIFSTTIRARFVALLDGVSVKVKEATVDALEEPVDEGWITASDLAEARRNSPADAPFPAPQEPPSDTPSPRARADSASTSTSDSTSGGRAHASDDTDASPAVPDPPPPEPAPPPTTWDRTWSTITSYVRRHGQHDPDRPDLELDDRSRAALATVGGIGAVRRGDVTKFDFRDAYLEAAKEHARG